MIWFKRIFGKEKQREAIVTGGCDARIRGWFESAARKSGWNLTGWQEDTLCFNLHDEGRHRLNCGNFISARMREGQTVTKKHVRAYVKQMNALVIDQEERKKRIGDLTKIKDLLRPRLLSCGTVDSNPRLARADHISGELVRAVAIDFGETSTFVTLDMLEKWSITFEECYFLGKQNLIGATSPDQFRPHEEGPTLLVCSPDDGIGSSRVLIIEEIFPNLSEKGFVFSVPASNLALIHLATGKDSIEIPPVMGLLALQVYENHSHPLNRFVYWHHGGTIEKFWMLPVNDDGTLCMKYLTSSSKRNFFRAMES